MNLKDHVTEIVITFIIAFVYTWIDSGEIGNEPSLAYRKKELKPLFYKVLALFCFSLLF